METTFQQLRRDMREKILPVLLKIFLAFLLLGFVFYIGSQFEELFSNTAL